MSVITLPTDLFISRMSWAQQRNDAEFRSGFGSQATEMGVPLWAVSIEVDRIDEESSGDWKAVLMQLRGRTNQLAVWDVARPAPRGTMRGTMTLNLAAAQGATSLSIAAGGEIAKTLVKGDLLGLGSGLTQQVVMLVSDAVSDGSGVIEVTTEPPLRNAHAMAAAVTWDKPTALFRRQTSRAGWDYETVFASGFSLDLLEDWRP